MVGGRKKKNYDLRTGGIVDFTLYNQNRLVDA
jgi:hypothetical protein